MRRLRVRIWIMMVLVAIVATTQGSIQLVHARADRFQKMYLYHGLEAGIICGERYPAIDEHARAWHEAMCWKYHFASSYPWLPLSPDPPPPK
jgi:hypothetical protein